MVLWAVVTPLVIFLVLVPGYVVATYVKHRLANINPGKHLLGKRDSSYYATIRPVLQERLQRQSSLNVPAKSKHLRSASATIPPQNQLVRLNKTSRRGCSSAPATMSILVTPQHKPDILETYSPYQLRTPSTDDEQNNSSPEGKLPTSYWLTDQRSKVNGSDNNNNGRTGKQRHLSAPRSSPHHSQPCIYTSPFISSKKLDSSWEERTKHSPF